MKETLKEQSDKEKKNDLNKVKAKTNERQKARQFEAWRQQARQLCAGSLNDLINDTDPHKIRRLFVT